MKKMRPCIIAIIVVLSTFKLTTSSPTQDVLTKLERLKLQIKEKLSKVHNYPPRPSSTPTPPDQVKITPIEKRHPKLKIKAIKRYKKRTMEKYRAHVRKIKQLQDAFDSYEPTTTDANSLDPREFNLAPPTVKIGEKILPIIENTTDIVNGSEIGARKAILHDYYHKLNEFKCKENKWVMCQKVITPFLIGQLHEETKGDHAFKTTDENYVYKRFMLLLKLSVETENKDELKAVLIQINKINLKLYFWNAKSITLLLKELITKDGLHTWRNLKKAMKYLFQKWDMNLNGTTDLMKNSKIYKPPCVIKGYEGSTMHPKLLNHYEITTEDAKTQEDSACLEEVERYENGKKKEDEHCDTNKRNEALLRVNEYIGDDADDSEEGIALNIE